MDCRCHVCWLIYVDPETWTHEELRRWLAAVRFSSLLHTFFFSNRLACHSFENNLPRRINLDSLVDHMTKSYLLGDLIIGIGIPKRTMDFNRIILIDKLQRNLHPNPKDTKEELLERVKANLRTPRTWVAGEVRLWSCLGTGSTWTYLNIFVVPYEAGKHHTLNVRKF